MKTRKNKLVIDVVTLGCSKNLVDSEFLLQQMNSNGITIRHNQNSEHADAVIINTCGFIKDSKEESIDTILQYIRAKEQGLIGKVFVMGCLSERYKSELEKNIPEVDKYFGVNNMKDIIEVIGYDYKANLTGERWLTTPNHYAYLKISEGCDRNCSFCAIPLIRGKYQSKSIQSVVDEAKFLVSKGVKELILIAQDLTYYGIDLYRKQKLPELLEQLAELENLEWIRLHYTYPASFPTDIIRIMNERDNICNYLDIPLQHINDSVLKNMRRGVTAQQTKELINYLRANSPGLTLRTTLMVGHPGEGEKEFAELMQFVEETKFDRLGVFTYSEEEDTYGAANFKDNIAEKIKQERAGLIMSLQEGISLNLNKEKIGSQQKVVIDRKEGELWIGRTESDSPDVDNEVLIASIKDLNIGDFYLVKVTGATEHDLLAEI
jgi:ribosomal protein S12 methylthiotransferase